VETLPLPRVWRHCPYPECGDIAITPSVETYPEYILDGLVVDDDGHLRRVD